MWVIIFLVIFSGWLSWLGNGVVILLLTKQLHTLQAQDFLTLNLAISDAGIAMFGYSRGILEVFNVFRDDGYLFQTFWTCQVKLLLIGYSWHFFCSTQSQREPLWNCMWIKSSKFPIILLFKRMNRKYVVYTLNWCQDRKSVTCICPFFQ